MVTKTDCSCFILNLDAFHLNRNKLFRFYIKFRFFSPYHKKESFYFSEDIRNVDSL